MSPTSIEWARNSDGTKGETWNPTVGCSKVSEGCGIGGGGCYALGVAHRAMQPAHVGLTIRRPGDEPDWTGEVRCLPERLDVPLRRRKATTWFVDSMSDLFHPDVPLDFLRRVWETMHEAHRMRGHTFQILTKRPQRMARALGPRGIGWYAVEGPVPCPEPGIWLGASIELDKYAYRADHVRATPTVVPFLSLEPLLGALPSLDLTGIAWVIVGGESGPGHREMDLAWLESIVAACRAAGVPVFVKQDSGRFSGRQGRIPDELWLKEMPQ